ncbi:MAG: hypothetical protein ACTHNW_10120 [Mucilaginibacter sp.]
MSLKKINRWFITAAFACAASAVMFSCKHTGQNGNTGNYDTAALNEYRSYLKSLDTLHPASTTTAAKKYAELFKSSEQNTRDSAFSVFKDFYNKIDQVLDNNRDITISYDSLITDSGGHLPALSTHLKTYAQTLKDNGFKVYLSEGNPYIGQDLDFEAKWFYPYLSQPLKEFLTQLNNENKEGFSQDGGLMINPEQLADRTVWWENFAKKYPQTIVGRPALENWRSYLGTLMVGMDNSPVTEPGHPKNLNPYYQAVYSRIMNNYSTTQTAKLIGPYFKLLINKKPAAAKKLVKDYESKKLIY